MTNSDLYHRHQPTSWQGAPASPPQPRGISMVDHFRNLSMLPIDARAGDGFTDAERQQAREIRHAMDNGQWGVGSIIPHRLMPLVFEGGLPEHMREIHASAGGDVTTRLATKIDASLATDPAHPRALATDTPRPGPLMSFRLAQVMQGKDVLDEDEFDSELLRVGVTSVVERIGLKTEAHQLGCMRPRGSQKGETYHPGMMGATTRIKTRSGEELTFSAAELADEDDPDIDESDPRALMRELWRRKLQRGLRKSREHRREGRTMHASADTFWVGDAARAAGLDKV